MRVPDRQCATPTAASASSAIAAGVEGQFQDSLERARCSTRAFRLRPGDTLEHIENILAW